MTLTVTPGSPDADAFVSVEDCTAFCAAQGLTDWTGAARSPADDDEAAIRRATRWLSTAFGWKGARTNGRSQALAHPRIDLTDGEGEEIPSDEIAIEVVQACCIAAAAERANPGLLSPAVDLSARIKSETVGPISVEYAAIPNQAELSRPVLLAVGDLIGGLLAGGTNALVGTAIRS